MNPVLLLIEKLASEVNAANVEKFIGLIEKLIALAESAEQAVKNAEAAKAAQANQPKQ